MPGRKIPLVVDEIYHVFNRGINRQPAFTNKWEYKRAMQCLDYYRFALPPAKLSVFLKTSNNNQTETLANMAKKKDTLIDILSYCLMPNHFHLLLRQRKEKGISRFMSKLLNSYTKYFNKRNKRDGSLFLDQFKAVRIETDEQLLHVQRYIHLNPYSSYLVSSIEELIKYPYTSLGEYLSKLSHPGEICEKGTILSYFKKKEEFKKFIINQADYQRSLDEIKHLALE